MNKDNEVKKILKDLSENEVVDKDVATWVNRLKRLYSGGYRHKYSEILRTLIHMEPESRDYLIVNLDIINKNKTSEIRDQFDKFYDHVSLEIIRLTQYKKYESKSNNLDIKIDNIEAQFKHIQNKISEENANLANLKKDMTSMQTSYISILGIFSSITFALFGGLNIISQIFSKITNLNDHNSFSGIMAIGGFVVLAIFNLLNMLMYSLGRIVGKDIISRKCEDSCYKQKCTCKWYKKVFIKYTHIAILNILMTIFIAVFLVVYMVG